MTIPPVISRPAASRRPSADSGARRRRGPALAPDRGPRRHHLEAAAPGAGALAVRPVQVDHHVPDLGAAARARRGRSGRRAAARCRCRCRARPAPRARRPRAAPKRVLGEQRHVRVVVDDHRQPEPLAHQVAERHVGERQVRRPRARRRSPSRPARGSRSRPPPRRGPPRAPPRPPRRRCRASPRGRAPRQVRCTRWWTTRPSSTTPPRSFVPPASIPITRLGGMAGRYTEVCDRPEPGGPPEYKVYRSPQAPARPRGGRPRRARSAGSAASPSASPTSPASAQADHARPGAQVARARGRRLAAAVAGPVPGQRPDPGRRLRRRRARPVERRQPARPAARSSCSAPTRAPASRSTRRSSGPSRADTIMLVHAALGSVRKLSIPRDTEAEIPGHGTQQDQRRLRARRPGADDRDGRGLPRQRARDQPPGRGRLRGLPRRSSTRSAASPSTTRRGSARRRSTTSGRASASARASIDLDGDAGARLRARAQEPLRARARTTAPAPRASRRCCGRSAAQAKSPGTFFRLPLGQLAGAQGAQDRHEGPGADGACSPTSPPATPTRPTCSRAPAATSRATSRSRPTDAQPRPSTSC